MRDPNTSSTDGAAPASGPTELGGDGGDGDGECLSHVYYWAENAVVPRQYVFEESLRIEAVALGRAHCCAMSATGLTFTWGDNRHGQLGHGDFVNRSEPQVCDVTLTEVKQCVSYNWTCVEPSSDTLRVCVCVCVSE